MKEIECFHCHKSIKSITIISLVSVILVVPFAVCWGSSDIVFKHIGKSEEWYVKTFGDEWGNLTAEIYHHQLKRLRKGKDYIYQMEWFAGYLAWPEIGPPPENLVEMFPIKSRKFKLYLEVTFDGKTQESLGYELRVIYNAYSWERGSTVKLYVPSPVEFVNLVNSVFDTKLSKTDETSYGSEQHDLSISLWVQSYFPDTLDYYRSFYLKVWPKTFRKEKYIN